MPVITTTIKLKTRGHCDIRNITDDVSGVLAESSLREGTVCVFVPGATGALTTLEYEKGMISDFHKLFDQLAPEHGPYEHDKDHPMGNGHSHVRAGLLGPSLVIPFKDGVMLLGVWQKIAFVDFDNRPRVREIVVQVQGE